MPGTCETAAPEEVESQLLWEHGRIGAIVVMASIAVMFVGEIVLRPGERPGISIVQALNFAVLGLCLLVARDPSQRTLNGMLCFIGFSASAIAIGAVGILARDPTSTLVVLVGLTLGTAVLVPWGSRYQFSAVVVTTASAYWMLVIIRPGSREFWLQPLASLLPAFAVSVIVAYLLRKRRLSLAEAERSLREANRRLEDEVRDHESTERALRSTLLELDHRVKNTLATLQSIAEQTLANSSSAEEFIESFRGRIAAMARIHTALAARRWEAIDLRTLIDLVVDPYRIHGDSISLSCDGDGFLSQEARLLGTALHELTTNATKYGALSTPGGTVDITAAIYAASERRLHLVWSERGGPPVREPEHRGLGTKLIESALAYESGGEVSLRFEEGGVCCEIDMPLRAAQSADDTPP